mmetsp:Transcript_121730/g.271842  ORF Transcript_121730/g.271842 Transcript_121730/m.271842 type:complete len:260 (-) Transcript_121730:35-814(-)
MAAGAVDGTEARKRARPLLSVQWAHLLARFLGSEAEEAVLNRRFHEDVQALFHEEVVRHFEYEAAERSLCLVRHRKSGSHCLHEVVRCLVENLEDYQSRLEAREFAWDATAQRLVPLDAALRQRLSGAALEGMEEGLLAALQAAAAAGDGAAAEAQLERRRVELQGQCAALLARKTEATQAYQERATELRREVMLFEAVEFLELHSAETSTTQVRTALHMLESVVSLAPMDAVERLRERLGRLAAGQGVAPLQPQQEPL